MIPIDELDDGQTELMIAAFRAGRAAHQRLCREQRALEAMGFTTDELFTLILPGKDGGIDATIAPKLVGREFPQDPDAG